MKPRFPLLSMAAASLLLNGCLATKSELTQYFKFHPDSVPVQKPRNPSAVTVVTMPATKSTVKQTERWIKEQGNRGYAGLGMAGIQGPMVSDAEVKKLAASVGGDLALHIAAFDGTRPASRMVVGAYTPASVSYTQANAYGYSSGSAYTSGSTPWGAMNFNTYGSGSSYGTANATTFNPGSTTYVREQYMEPIFSHYILVLQSPKAQLDNWWNFVRYSNANWVGRNNIKAVSDDEARAWAANFAQQHGLRLPASLKPKTGQTQEPASSVEQVDLNRDGTVSRKEFSESVVKNSALKYDTNKDGVITTGEYLAGGGTANSFSKIDTKGRGRITTADARRSTFVQESAGRVFDFSDKNKDGLLDAGEFATYKKTGNAALQKVAAAN